ncbi:MAG: hypothetical protein K6G45_10790 [Lachnospiraceae bacterium]|nr:hypothetical protein [Lachnospiraceae bacterium]
MKVNNDSAALPDQVKEKKIIGFMSASGQYFQIIMKKKGVYYLKNEYTEVPNEFGLYSMKTVAELYKGLRRCLSKTVSEEAEEPSGHPNSCFYVIYEDNTRKLYRKKDDARLNVTAFTNKAATYSEWVPGTMYVSEFVTLDRLRDAVECGEIAYDIFLQAVKHLVQDGETGISPHIHDDGSIDLDMNVQGREYSFIKIGVDGLITQAGNLASELDYVKILKDNNVKVVRINRIKS